MRLGVKVATEDEMQIDKDIAILSDAEVCRSIATRTEEMMGFWKSAKGWAPVEAAGLLSRSMLEWQSSLSEALEMWLDCQTDGQLILAWANLGALVEGQLKLFLSVFYKDYLKPAQVGVIKRGTKLDPDGCGLNDLRQFFAKEVWREEFDWDVWIKHVQERRNSIHAFKHRDIGTFAEWRNDLRLHLGFIHDLDSRLPYPENGSYRDFTDECA